MLKSNKNQITIFIIVGIVVLLLSVTTIYILSESTKINIDQKDFEEVSLDRNSIHRHVEECIINTRQIIKDVVQNGGELNPINSLKYNGKNYNFWCYQSGNDGCKNKIFSKVKIARTLERELKPRIDNCLDFSIYENQGYDFKSELSEIRIVVSPLFVDIYYNKPIVFTRNEEIINLENFHQRLNLPVGRLIDIANLILNSEIQDSYFNKDKWMFEHGAEIQIRKFRPYPHTIYNLAKFLPQQNEWIELNFAIEGRDTVSILNLMYTSNPKDWCLIQNECFFNPSSSQCTNILSSKPTECDILYNNNPLCEGDECQNCGIREHGESWCEYDGIVGSGLDFVGSRHYLVSCINGVIYNEPCRDYREEICVQQDRNAMCKPNRWKTCMQQMNEADCVDTSHRDCYWIKSAFNPGGFNKDNYRGSQEIKCFPQVPPGFKFWSYHGNEVCQMGNEWIDCDELSCPQAWSDNSMIGCKKLGDCGNSYTINSLLSDSSFFTSDLAIRRTSWPPIDLLINPDLNADKTVLVRNNLEYSQEVFGPSVFDCDDCTLEYLLERLNEYTQYLASLSKSDLMWEFITDGAISYHTRHFNLCMPFQLFETGDCNSCFSESKPCTEYKCRSLGNRCFFYVDEDGYGQCNETQSSNIPLTILESTIEVFPHSNIESNSMFSEFFGFHILNSVEEFSPLRVTFNTSKPAQCKKTLVPVPQQSLPFDFDFTQSNYEPGFFVEHDITFYPLPKEYIKNEIDKFFAISSLFDFTLIDSFDERLEQIKNDLRSVTNEFGGDSSEVENIIDEINKIYQSNIRPQIEMIQNEYITLFTSFAHSIESGIGYMFFNCIDYEGNPAITNFYLSFYIEEDNTPPILKSFAVNDDIDEISNPVLKLNIFLNEPSQCKADFIDVNFEDMNLEMDCDENFIPTGEGFECELVTNKRSENCNPSNNKARVFVRCRDKLYEDDITNVNINPFSFVFDYLVECS